MDDIQGTRPENYRFKIVKQWKLLSQPENYNCLNNGRLYRKTFVICPAQSINVLQVRLGPSSEWSICSSRLLLGNVPLDIPQDPDFQYEYMPRELLNNQLFAYTKYRI
jgi:hypothetical protein